MPQIADSLTDLLPKALRELRNPQTDLPRIAKDQKLTGLIESALRDVPTEHDLRLGDARVMGLEPESVHLVLTSPPYWTLKEYRDSDGQLGHVDDYEQFLSEIDTVWESCFRALVPGGRLIVVVGDVCLSRRKNNGRHTVVPLHASIQEHCRQFGFDNLAPIIWHKISNAVYEVEGNGSSFLGKPYEPNAVIKNDIEFILMQRKPGGYRTPSVATRVMSVIPEDRHREWFQQIWHGLTGASTKNHPAPFPIELAERLIRMFSFVGDTVLDPFMGTASTNIAASRCGRNSIGVEIDPHYFEYARKRVDEHTRGLFSTATVKPAKNGSHKPQRVG
ncbi:MAG: site-specific DNA-methyltransferase [Planctomycetaceae bacterium]